MKSKLITSLEKCAQTFAKKHDSINDIILFGSYMRGKHKVNDYDILIVFEKAINKEYEYTFRKRLEKLVPGTPEVISKTEKTLLDSSFLARDGIFFEGYSLLSKSYLAEQKGLTAYGIFIYSTKGLSNSYKTRFYYALNGRYTEGMLKQFDCIRLADTIVAVPLRSIEMMREFFDNWEIEYRYVPMLFPTRLAKRHILEIVK